MGFKLIEPGQVRARFPYINSKAGILEADGICLIMRPLSLDELEAFESKANSRFRWKENPRKGKGFRDRGQDKRDEAILHSDPELLREVKRERIKAALIGWEGFEDAAGQPLSYSFENFMRVCQILPDLFQFASEKIDEANEEAIGKLRALKDSEKNSPTGAASA